MFHVPCLNHVTVNSVRGSFIWFVLHIVWMVPQLWCSSCVALLFSSCVSYTDLTSCDAAFNLRSYYYLLYFVPFFIFFHLFSVLGFCLTLNKRFYFSLLYLNCFLQAGVSSFNLFPSVSVRQLVVFSGFSVGLSLPFVASVNRLVSGAEQVASALYHLAASPSSNKRRLGFRAWLHRSASIICSLTSLRSSTERCSVRVWFGPSCFILCWEFPILIIIPSSTRSFRLLLNTNLVVLVEGLFV